MKLTNLEVKYINKVSTPYPIPYHAIPSLVLPYSIHPILSNNIRLVSSYSIVSHPISSHFSHSILSLSILSNPPIQFLSFHLIPPILLLSSRPILSYSTTFHSILSHPYTSHSISTHSIPFDPIPTHLIPYLHIPSMPISSHSLPTYPIPTHFILS